MEVQCSIVAFMMIHLDSVPVLIIPSEGNVMLCFIFYLVFEYRRIVELSWLGELVNIILFFSLGF